MTKQKFDVVIVLGAKSCNAPSAALRRRINQGVSTFQKSGASHLLLCGGSSNGHTSEAEQMARVAVEAGVPATSIVTEPRSISTWENAEFSSSLIRQYNWRSACIVSDSFHLPRAYLVFRRTPLETIHLVSAGPVPISLAVHMWMREMIGIAWYLVRLVITRR